MKKGLFLGLIFLFLTAFAASNLEGTYNSQSSNQYSKPTLTISNADQKGFDFQFNVSSGANTGELSNKAVFVGKDAVFKDIRIDQVTKNSCTIHFKLSANTIDVNANQACSLYAGVGVSFDGKYSKNAAEKKLDLVQLGLLSNAKQQDDFKKLTASDYDVFLKNCGTLLSETEQSTDPKASYKEASVRGLETVMGCIIMTNENNIWAAVIDTNQNDIKYFSNDPNYKNKMPKVIQDWVNSRSDHAKVKFGN